MTQWARRRKARFDREIQAMYQAKNAEQTACIVEIACDGYVQSSGMRFRCFLMEKANVTLRGFLEEGSEVGHRERLHLCITIGRSILALHRIGVYHRDIKPENVLLVQNSWKIADLGLVAKRGEDIDGEREPIGAKGWMAPEAVNKAYADSTKRDIITEIDECSDAHQLGKLFWYILQGDIPNGNVKSADFRAGTSDLFGRVLKPLLWYNRSLRPRLCDVLEAMEPLTRVC
jgi:serine/threonine protein kinase